MQTNKPIESDDDEPIMVQYKSKRKAAKRVEKRKGTPKLSLDNTEDDTTDASKSAPSAEVQHLQIQTHRRKAAGATLPARDELTNSSSSNTNTLPKLNLQLRNGGAGGNVDYTHTQTGNTSFTVVSHPVDNKIGIKLMSGGRGDLLQFDQFIIEEGTRAELYNGATLGDDANLLAKGDQLVAINGLAFEGIFLSLSHGEKMKMISAMAFGSVAVRMT